ncbi:MAG TPA: M48 family metallopeptidase [Vicinamibacterales bacterium]|nr:M48 family metallopeptidase [Vicinamibacterales bacterium]
MRAKSRIYVKPALIAACLSVWVATAGAQAQITAPKNRYSPAEDVQLGREAAQQVEKELPVMRDEQVNSYLNSIGRRLVNAIPAQFQHSEFRYSFTGVNLREINAFALPGGPMFINRGMIEKAHTEGEVAGVMAHELSHVALRHGTAQQTKATKYAIGQMAGQIAGAIIGGRTGAVVAQGSQFGIGTYFMKFSREYEKQADLLGARIMAAAGYDPRDMANVFKTIEQESGPGGPQWMSDHPNPGNRYEYLNQEARLLHVEGATHDTRDFQSVQAHLHSLSPAPTSEDVARNRNAGRTTSGGESRPISGNVARPDTRFTAYNEGNLFRISVPSNWREFGTNNSVTFAPDGAYGTANGQSVFTHGVEVGVARNESHDLETATTELIRSLQQANPRLSRPSGYERGTIGGRQGLRTVLSNVSDATGGQEAIEIYTTQLSDGSLFYAFGVAPRGEYNAYSNVFRNVIRSIQFSR